MLLYVHQLVSNRTFFRCKQLPATAGNKAEGGPRVDLNPKETESLLRAAELGSNSVKVRYYKRPLSPSTCCSNYIHCY